MARAVPRPWEFERFAVTDQTDLKRTEEIIREKLFMRLNKELPYQLRQVLIGGACGVFGLLTSSYLGGGWGW